jgi:hypothetical protein
MADGPVYGWNFLRNVSYTQVANGQLKTMNDQLGQQKSDAASNATQFNRQLKKLNVSVYEQGRVAIAEA